MTSYPGVKVREKFIERKDLNLESLRRVLGLSLEDFGKFLYGKLELTEDITNALVDLFSDTNKAYWEELEEIRLKEISL